jgi:hypothetical protein
MITLYITRDGHNLNHSNRQNFINNPTKTSHNLVNPNFLSDTSTELIQTDSKCFKCDVRVYYQVVFDDRNCNEELAGPGKQSANNMIQLSK